MRSLLAGVASSWFPTRDLAHGWKSGVRNDAALPRGVDPEESGRSHERA